MTNMRKSGFRVVLGGASFLAVLAASPVAMAQGNPNYSFFPNQERAAPPADDAARAAPPPVAVQTPTPEEAPGAVTELAPPAGAGDGVTAPPASGEAAETAEADSEAARNAAIDVELARAVRSLPDGTEPLSAADTRRLDQFGVISRQAGVGEDILIMDRELKRAQSIDSLIALMGVDGFRTTFPELYELLKDSPIMLRAEIQRHELIGALKVAKDGPEPEKKIDAALRPRDDGSSFFQMPEPPVAPGNGMPPPVSQNAPPAEAAEDVTPADALAPAPALAKPQAVVVSIPISLREVYGLDGEFYAIITHGDERIRVSEGDVLPGETTIKAIGDGYIDIIRRGEEIRIRIRG